MNQMKSMALGCVLITLLAAACERPPTSNPSNLVELSGFDRPQGLLFHGDELVVANSAYRANSWGEGSIQWINQHTKELVGEHKTHALNPQQIRTLARWIAVVESGRFDFSDFERPRAVSPFGIELFGRDNDEQWIKKFIELPPQSEIGSVSGPMDIATIGTTSVVTSGLFNAFWRIEWSDMNATDVSSIKVISLEPTLETGLGSVIVWRNYFLIADFNQDRLYLIDSDGEMIRCNVHLGEDNMRTEGLQTPTLDGDHLYVSFAFSGQVWRYDLAEFAETCEAEPERLDVVLGQVPNDLDIVGNELWVTQSGENNILRIDLTLGRRTDTIVLPVSSNPWHFTVNDDFTLGAVSLWYRDAVTFINLEALPEANPH